MPDSLLVRLCKLVNSNDRLLADLRRAETGIKGCTHPHAVAFWQARRRAALAELRANRIMAREFLE